MHGAEMLRFDGIAAFPLFDVSGIRFCLRFGVVDLECGWLTRDPFSISMERLSIPKIGL
jgi:hypothetical protein